MNNESLRPEFELIYREIAGYHYDRLLDHQAGLDRKRMAKELDGEFSLTRLLNAQREYRVRQLAPYEHACSEQIAEQIGRAPHQGCSFVPVSRDLTVGVAGSGGHLVETVVAPGDVFASYLDAASVLTRQGVQRVRLVGNATIPRFSGTVTTGWQATEGSVITESQFSFATASASPKTVGAYLECSDLFLKQTSPFVQQRVLQQLAQSTAAERDKQFVNGDGAAGRPLGLLQTAGIGSVTGTTLAYTGILDIVKYLEDRSAIVTPGKAGFVVAPDVARLLRVREKVAGSGTIMTGNDLAGYPAQVTKSIPDATLLFADWSQVVVLEWGVLEVGTDPFGANGDLFKKGIVGIRSFWSTDLVVLHVDSFCKATAIT